MLVYYVSITGYAQIQPTRRLAFSGSFQPAATLEILLLEPMDTVLAPPILSSETTPLPDYRTLLPELETVKEQLITVMETEKPYLEPDLSLADLARRIQVNSVVLSQVINMGTGRNFNDFINAYRVDEFKREVLNPANAHLSFLGLALNCGFNSKATFNRAFRKFTGTSPGAFAEERA